MASTTGYPQVKMLAQKLKDTEAESVLSLDLPLMTAAVPATMSAFRLKGGRKERRRIGHCLQQESRDCLRNAQ